MGNLRVEIKKNLKALAVFLCGLLMVFGNATALAATTKGTQSTTVNSQELKISPVRTDLNITAGTTGTVKVIVTNLTSGPLTVQPIENDFVAGGEEGQPALILSPDSYAPSHSLKRFMVPLSNLTLAAGAAVPVTVTITVTFGVTGAVYDTASVVADQINSSTQQGVAFGTPPAQGGDGPLPLWSYVVLALAFYWVGARRLRVGGVGGTTTSSRDRR